MGFTTKKLDYFDAFEQLSKVACKEVDLLIEVIENFSTAENIEDYLPRAHELEHEGDEINHAIFTAITVDFITPIEREDILNLGQALDEIIDNIEDVIQLFYMFDIHFMHKDALGLAEMIRKSCYELSKAMEDFRYFKKSDKFREAVIRVNTYEEEADEMYIRLMRRLHTVDRENTMRVLVWTQIFGRMEKCTDSCERVADMMSSILLKNA